jgi:hypothetical protein
VTGYTSRNGCAPALPDFRLRSLLDAGHWVQSGDIFAGVLSLSLPALGEPMMPIR